MDGRTLWQLVKYARFPTDILSEDRIMSLERSDRWLWFEVVCAAVSHNKDGALPPLEQLAMDLGQDVWEIESGLFRLEKAALAQRKNGWWWISDYAEYKSSSAERQRRYRERNGGGSGKAPYKQVMLSWNVFAAEVGLNQIRGLSDKRKAAIRQRHDEIWPHIDEIYDRIRNSEFLKGRNDRGWAVDFDYVWCRRDGAMKLLEGMGQNGKGGGGGMTWAEMNAHAKANRRTTVADYIQRGDKWYTR